MQHDRGNQPQGYTTIDFHGAHPQPVGTDRKPQNKPGDTAAPLSQAHNLLVVHATGFRTQRPPGTPPKVPPVYYVSAQNSGTSISSVAAQQQIYNGLTSQQVTVGSSLQAARITSTKTSVAPANGAVRLPREQFSGAKSPAASIPGSPGTLKFSHGFDLDFRSSLYPPISSLDVNPSQEGPGRGSDGLDPGSGSHMAYGSYVPLISNALEADLIEAGRRRARRHHRKEIARIVVDQWKWFARGRLQLVSAVRHYRHQLQLAGFLGLRCEVDFGRARARQAMVLASKIQAMHVESQMMAWWREAKWQQDARSKLHIFQISSYQRHARSLLLQWKAWRQRKTESRRMELRAFYLFAFTTFGKVMQRLRSNAIHKIEHRADMAIAALHYAITLKRLAVLAWALSLKGTGIKLAKVQAAGCFEGYWLVRRKWLAWRSSVCRIQEGRAAASLILENLSQSMFRISVQSALIEWREWAERRLRLRQHLRYALAYLRRWRQLVVLWGWRHAAAALRRQRAVASLLAPIGHLWYLQLLFDRWALAVEILQGQRNTEIRAFILIRATWAAWRSHHRHVSIKSSLTTRATAAIVRLKRVAVLREWREVAGMLHVWRRKKVAMVEWGRTQRMSNLLSGWYDVAQCLASKASNMKLAAAHYTDSLLARGLEALARHTRRRALKQEALLHHRRYIQLATVCAWRGHSQYKQHRESQRRSAVRHRYLCLLSNGVQALSHAVAARKLGLHQMTAAAHHHAHTLKATAMLVWCTQFLPAVAEQRVKSGRAALQWRRGLLRHALSAWRAEAERLAVKHGRYREVHSIHCRRMMCRTLRLWADYPALREQRAVGKQTMLERHRAVLAALLLRRVLSGWRRVHEGWVMKRFQAARARGSWSERLERKAMTAWLAFTVWQRLSAYANSRAAALFWKRHCSRAWQAWVQHVERRRARRAAEDLATQHWHSRCVGSGLAGLRWFVSHRRQKASDLAEAQAMAVRRLQREGALQWLKVGLARRQQRQAQLAMHQARTLAAELAIVEPYARHWRYIVQQRRRARMATGIYAGLGGPSWWQAAALPPQASYHQLQHTAAARAPIPSPWTASASSYIVAQRGVQSDKGVGTFLATPPAAVSTTSPAHTSSAACTGARVPSAWHASTSTSPSLRPSPGQTQHSVSSQPSSRPKMPSEPNRIISPMSSPILESGVFQVSPQDFLARSRNRPAARRPDFFMHSLSDPTHSLQHSGGPVLETPAGCAQPGKCSGLPNLAQQHQPNADPSSLGPPTAAVLHGNVHHATITDSRQQHLQLPLPHASKNTFTATQLHEDAGPCFVHTHASQLTNRYLQLLPHPSSHSHFGQQHAEQRHSSTQSQPGHQAASSEANCPTGNRTRSAAGLQAYSPSPSSIAQHALSPPGRAPPWNPSGTVLLPCTLQSDLDSHQHGSNGQQGSSHVHHSSLQNHQQSSHAEQHPSNNHHHSPQPHPESAHTQSSGYQTHEKQSHLSQQHASHALPDTFITQPTTSRSSPQENSSHGLQDDSPQTHDLDTQMRSIELVLRQCQMLKSQANAVSAELEYNVGLLAAAPAEQRHVISTQQTALVQRLGELNFELEIQRPMVLLAASGIRRLREAQASRDGQKGHG